jgi:hypothetical protein
MTTGIEQATFRLVAQCLSQMCQSMVHAPMIYREYDYDHKRPLRRDTLSFSM